jgi:hypothetical protein
MDRIERAMIKLRDARESRFDIPMGPCEWVYDKKQKVYFTSCNTYYEVESEYCPHCQGQVIIEGREE